MKFKTTCCLVLSALCCAGAAAAREASPPARPGAAAGANAVAFKFYAQESAKPGNLFFSPYSMRTAFAMVYEGARGKTAGEIASVFSFPAKAAGLRAELAALDKELAVSAKGAQFTQANSFWAQDGYKFLPAYLSVLGRTYKAEARNADFTRKTEEARAAINGWTAEKTGGKIKELFPEGALTSLTRLALVNAVYFKGAWTEAFQKDMTFDADFTRSDGSTITARMMASPDTKKAWFSESEELQALRLPYKGGKLSLLVLLPGQGKDLAGLEKGLTAEKLDAIRAGLGEQKVKVFLPRFGFSSGYNLNGTLAGLGMPTAFTDAADFSGMDGKKDLYIQAAVHKAFVEVNEEGTEAAAATGVAMGLKSMAFDLAVFRANRPFLFFIEDYSSGLILFMGRVEDPTKN